ncbi:hypothetical protein HNP84_008027 [Thermocatellispora tengchongensis]|uniref:Uncharacterized protein n=1 Tax=Thermocatellispora tengchongensis TaxID=1073253 RepID=A0A840PA61_9ACTN|nr:hypothetical protein [Thermocatellispora tengchongensis]
MWITCDVLVMHRVWITEGMPTCMKGL